MKLTGFKVLACDVLGTLIDWERGIAKAHKAELASGKPTTYVCVCYCLAMNHAVTYGKNSALGETRSDI